MQVISSLQGRYHYIDGEDLERNIIRGDMNCRTVLMMNVTNPIVSTVYYLTDYLVTNPGITLCLWCLCIIAASLQPISVYFTSVSAYLAFEFGGHNPSLLGGDFFGEMADDCLHHWWTNAVSQLFDPFTSRAAKLKSI